ncbi:hypothetical protein [Parasutterella excrementihominis]
MQRVLGRLINAYNEINEIDKYVIGTKAAKTGAGIEIAQLTVGIKKAIHEYIAKHYIDYGEEDLRNSKGYIDVSSVKFDKNKPTTAAEPAPLKDTTGAPKVTHTPVTGSNEPIAVQTEPAQKTAPTPEKEVTPAAAADGEKAEKKAAPKVTPPVSKSAEQTAPKAQGWIEKPKSDDKLNSASQENYADKSDADLDKERRLLCRDAVLKGAQPEAVRNFTIEKFGVRTVGAIPREKHGEWVRTFKETFGV